MSALETWGRYKRTAQHGIDIYWRSASLPPHPHSSVLPYGQGRSYGDVAQNTTGQLLSTGALDRFLSFDATTGLLCAESGMRLHDLLRFTAPQGWYLPVVPGTKYVSLGGAVANDVHGKNHHRAGTFGHHVRRLELLRSNGDRLVCSPDENRDLYLATIGGLGLTGLITWVEVLLSRTNCYWVDVETVLANNVREFIDLCEQSGPSHEYTVGWFDCFSARSGAFRGLFTRANPSAANERPKPSKVLASVPITPPMGMLHPSAMRLFNRAYHRLGKGRAGGITTVPLEQFMYPLDRIGHWNRLYGPEGFLQLQCVIPRQSAVHGAAELLDVISASGQGTFLAVIKQFGSIPSLGILSFPQEGTTIALDFPYRGPETLRLFAQMHAVVDRHHGRVYPAKDACMTSATFEAGYPGWRRMEEYIDPSFSSDFWRRVTGARCPHE